MYTHYYVPIIKLVTTAWYTPNMNNTWLTDQPTDVFNNMIFLFPKEYENIEMIYA